MGVKLGAGVYVLALLLLSGCDTLNYYNQAIWGQIGLLSAREGLDRVLEDPATSAELRERLIVAQDILKFAQSDLDMAVDKRYASYVELGRPYAVWNVVAASEYAVTAKEWCFLVVGCVPYRGYFAENDAQRAAVLLERAGLETYVGGVPAYSTLGWFDDPLLSSFIHLPDLSLVNLLLHELAHSKVWVDADVRFNENFASFVGEAGARMWADRAGRASGYRQWRANRQAWVRFKQFVLSAKSYLADGYAELDRDASRAVFKTEAMLAFTQCYTERRDDLGGGRFDDLVHNKLNNAYLASLGTYEDLQPAFSALFDRVERKWPDFFSAVDELAELAPSRREERLVELSNSVKLGKKQVGEGANNGDAGEIHCGPFAHHSGDRDTAG